MKIISAFLQRAVQSNVTTVERVNLENKSISSHTFSICIILIHRKICEFVAFFVTKRKISTIFFFRYFTWKKIWPQGSLPCDAAAGHRQHQTNGMLNAFVRLREKHQALQPVHSPFFFNPANIPATRPEKNKYKNSCLLQLFGK